MKFRCLYTSAYTISLKDPERIRAAAVALSAEVLVPEAAPKLAPCHWESGGGRESSRGTLWQPGN